jgi:NAD+ synthase
MQNKAPLRITMAQINPTVGDIAGNAEKILDSWNAHKDHSDLIVFSELILSGYQPEDLVLHDHFIDYCMRIAHDIAQKTKDGPALIISSPWRDEDGDKHNTALFVHEGEIKAALPKYELPNYGVFDEVRVFDKGELPHPVEYSGYKLGIGTCEDFWFPTVAKHLKDHGADILISLNGSPFEVQKDQMRLDIISNRVRETGLPAFYINQVGGQDEIVFDGGSFAMNADGEVIAHLPFFEEAIETITSLSFRESVSEPRNLRPLDYARDDNKLIYECLKLGLRDYVDKNGFPGVIIGSSGGIDSALSVAIAVDAIGADRVQCVMMPSPYTSQDSLDDAKALSDNLGCHHSVLSIQSVMDAYHNLIPDMSDIALENIQSRARGVALMALSNTNGKMVLSTGNKSEMAVGYATLYGDMCGGYNVLKDVYKTTVYALAKWRNEQSPVIPDNIISRPPSAELKPDQTDQDSLPDYDILDKILEGFIEDRKSISQLVSEGIDEDTARQVRRLLDRSEYKRRQAPPGVKISKHSFGRERRMPMTNHYESA